MIKNMNLKKSLINIKKKIFLKKIIIIIIQILDENENIGKFILKTKNDITYYDHSYYNRKNKKL